MWQYERGYSRCADECNNGSQKYDSNALKETINIHHRTYKHYNFLIYTKYFLLHINNRNSQENIQDLYN